MVGFVLLGLGGMRYEAWVYLKLLPHIGLDRLLGPLRGEGASPECVHLAQGSAVSSGRAPTVT